MTIDEINKAVAEGFGWNERKGIPKDCDTNCHYWSDKDNVFMQNVFTWTPATNPQQALDHIVPVLNEMGFIIDFRHSNNPTTPSILIHHEDEDRMHEAGGKKGATPSERMAYALCQVFLKVKEDK